MYYENDSNSVLDTVYRIRLFILAHAKRCVAGWCRDIFGEYSIGPKGYTKFYSKIILAYENIYFVAICSKLLIFYDHRMCFSS